VSEKAAHDIRRHLGHDQPIDGRLVVIGGKRDQESKRVTITALGIAGEIALHQEMLEEEPTDPPVAYDIRAGRSGKRPRRSA
jgi:hypothetical protein